MSLNDLFLDFISHFPLKVKGENCINTDKEEFCNRCKNACPHNAIEFQDNKPVVNTEKCTVCGLCFSECPVNVFEIEIDLAEFFTERGNPLIGCYLSDLEVDIKVPCLGILNEEILAGLAIKLGDLYLDTSKCKVCPQKGVYQYIKDYIERANLLLHYHRVENKVYEVSQEPEREEDILSELFGEEVKKKPSVSKKINVPLWRQLFFESVKTLNGNELCYQPVKEEKLRFAKPVIDQGKCQRSNVCSFWCPTRALSSDQKGVYFTQILCTDCGLCEKICPNNAITLEKSFIPRRNVMAGKTLIGKGEKKTCKRCGKEFVGLPNEDYCLYCRKDLEMENLIKDFLLGGGDGKT